MLIDIIYIVVCSNYATRAHARMHARARTHARMYNIKTLPIMLHVFVRIRLTYYITFVKINQS